MRRILRIAALLMLSASASLPALAQAPSKPERNEQQASRFLYCMNVAQFFYQYLRKNDPGNPGLPGYRDVRIHYRMAAALLSHGEFIQSESERALQAVVRILEREKEEQTDLMNAENASCARTFVNDVVPLLRSQ